jgi:hypothetical protein
MVKQRFGGVAALLGLVALVGAGIGVGIEPSYAGNCGGHCQAGKMCFALVKQKAIKDQSQRREEYQKCMRGPDTYK